MPKTILKYLLPLCSFWLLALSCKKEQACHIPTDITAKVTFGLKDIRDSIINTDSVVIDTTFVFFRDTLLPLPALSTYEYDTNFTIQGLRGISTLPFSLDPDKASISYIMFPNYELTSARDTLTVYYKSNLFFISNDCGFTYNYEIDSAVTTNNLIDSIHVAEKLVTTDGSKRHIKLYFFPQ